MGLGVLGLGFLVLWLHRPQSEAASPELLALVGGSGMLALGLVVAALGGTGGLSLQSRVLRALSAYVAGGALVYGVFIGSSIVAHGWTGTWVSIAQQVDAYPLWVLMLWPMVLILASGAWGYGSL